MFLGYRLKLLRKQNGLTQEDLGKLLGVSKVSISGYEKGTRIPGLDILIMILDVFNVSADYILGREINVICENNDEMSLVLAKNDIVIIREIRNRPVLYEKILEDPRRFFDSMGKK